MAACVKTEPERISSANKKPGQISLIKVTRFFVTQYISPFKKDELIRRALPIDKVTPNNLLN
jgi:hypothetical protein